MDTLMRMVRGRKHAWPRRCVMSTPGCRGADIMTPYAADKRHQAARPMLDESGEALRLLENVIFLKKTRLFSNVRTCELKAIAAIIDERRFRSGYEIVKENDIGDSLYIIREGRVRIAQRIKEGEYVDLAELAVGECFGDMAVIDEEVRSASVFAIKECILLCITRDNLMDVIIEYPHIAIELLKVFVRRLRAANIRIKDLSDAYPGGRDS
jgi:CRP-like cAMP-binding protein